MFELSGVNYEEVLEQGDSILVRVIASSSYRGFELSGLYCSSLRPFEYISLIIKIPCSADNVLSRMYIYTHIYH